MRRIDIELELATNEIELRQAIEENQMIRAFELKLARDLLQGELIEALKNEIETTRKVGQYNEKTNNAIFN